MDKIKVEIFPHKYKLPYHSRLYHILKDDVEFVYDNTGDIIYNCSSRLGTNPYIFNKPCINERFFDDSKSNVERHYVKKFKEKTFINPLTYKGKYVRKTEGNGFHDGVMFSKPQKKELGYIYQKFINTKNKNGIHIDIRACIFDYKTKFIFLKEKNDAFNTNPQELIIRENKEIFSKEIIKKINRFCLSIGLEYGELDILKDRRNKYYIIDVNNTPGCGTGLFTLKMKNSIFFFARFRYELNKLIKNKL